MSHGTQISGMSQATEEMVDDIVSDAYIEHLKRKYLTKKRSHEFTQSPKTTASTDVESYSDLPANPSLTETERRHYNRAMKEIGKALILSKNAHKSALEKFENSIKIPVTSSSEPGRGDKSRGVCNLSQETNPVECTKNDEVDTAKPISSHCNSEIQSQSDLHSISTLPSTIPIERRDDSGSALKSLMTASSLEEAALYWGEESSAFNGLSHRIFSNPEAIRSISMADIKAIYAELAGIYKKVLMEKEDILKKRDAEQKFEISISLREHEIAIREALLLKKDRELSEREQSLALAMHDMKSCNDLRAKLEGVEMEVQDKFESLQEKHKLQLEKMDGLLSTQTQEAKRLKSSFQVVKDQNEELRSRLASFSDECQKLKSQNAKLRKRLENLQRKQEFQSIKTDKTFRRSNKENNEKASASLKYPEKPTKLVSTTTDALTVLFDWVVESVFKTKDAFHLTDFESKVLGFSDEFIVDKCLKILPMFVDILKASTPYPSLKKNQFSYLSFIYHCLRRIDDPQHSILSSTTRRLGDELYKPVMPTNPCKDSTSSLILATTAAYSVVDSLEEVTQSLQQGTTKLCQNLYFRSSAPEVRMLSCFIIIKTLHQVDILAHVFGQLKKDLRDDVNRKLFLDFYAVHILMPYMVYKSNKALLGDAIDVFLQMAMESSVLTAFLEQCSTEEWFRTFSSVIRDFATSIDKPSFNPNILEKICVILQKLSKTKSNKKYFDAFAIGRSLQECYRCRDPENTFLSLNLRSILFNLDLIKEP